MVRPSRANLAEEGRIQTRRFHYPALSNVVYKPSVNQLDRSTNVQNCALQSSLGLYSRLYSGAHVPRIHRLTDRQVRTTKKALGDGGNLWIVPRGGSRSWFFRYRLGGRSRSMGIDTYPDVPLGEA